MIFNRLTYNSKARTRASTIYVLWAMNQSTHVTINNAQYLTQKNIRNTDMYAYPTSTAKKNGNFSRVRIMMETKSGQYLHAGLMHIVKLDAPSEELQMPGKVVLIRL
jgi:hypothetical protein